MSCHFSYFSARSIFYPLPLLALLESATCHLGPNVNCQLPVSARTTSCPTNCTIRYSRHHCRARSRWRRLRPSPTWVSPGFEKSMRQAWNNLNCRWSSMWVWEDRILFRDRGERSETWYIGHSKGRGFAVIYLFWALNGLFMTRALGMASQLAVWSVGRS